MSTVASARIERDAAKAAFDAAYEKINSAPETITKPALDKLVAEFDAATGRLDRANAAFQQADEQRTHGEAHRLAFGGSATGEIGGVYSVREPVTYRRDNQSQTSFSKDAIDARLGDTFALERIVRHHREMADRAGSREQYDISTFRPAAAS